MKADSPTAGQEEEAMSWGGLNPALTSWRNGINRRLPGRDIRTDGARADKAHSERSEHQEDADGTVDAFDQDINVLKSSTPTGTPAEDRIIEAMKLDFEQDPHRRGQLWIEDREIANADIDNWRERAYDGDSPHTEHIHWQSRQSREHIDDDWPMPHLDALLRELRGELPVEQAAFNKLMDGWAKTPNGKAALTSLLDAKTGDPSNPDRMVRNHLIDLSQVRDYDLDAPNAKPGVVKPESPLGRRTAAAAKTLAEKG